MAILISVCEKCYAAMKNDEKHAINLVYFSEPCYLTLLVPSMVLNPYAVVVSTILIKSSPFITDDPRRYELATYYYYIIDIS